MKLTKVIVYIVLLSITIGFEIPSKPTENMFVVGVDELKDVRVSEPFVITGYVKNESKKSWDLSFGAGLFTYELYDKSGNIVKTDAEMLFRNDIGYSTKIGPGEVYRNNGEEHRSREFYQYTIQHPGIYKVRTTAEFNVVDNNQEYKFIVSSKFFEFVVK